MQLPRGVFSSSLVGEGGSREGIASASRMGGYKVAARLPPLTRPRSASPPRGYPLPGKEKDNGSGVGLHQFVSAGRSFLTSASLGSTDAPSTYLKSVIVPLPFSSAILPT